jgi:hypothetical protein
MSSSIRGAIRGDFLYRVIKLVNWLLIFVPAVLGFLYVRAFGVNVVFSDAWSVARLFGRWSSGTLRLADLYVPHNEHRMFFPKGVELLLGMLTKYNNVAEMYLIEICLLVTLIILLLVLRENTKPWLILFVPVSLLIFSFRQYENMLFGFQINFAFTQTFGVLTLFLLHVFAATRYKKVPFAAALGSATVASFSTAQGLFVWPAGLLQLLMSSTERSPKKVWIVVWSLVGLGEWVAYFTDYSTKTGDQPSLLYALRHPATGAQYFLNLLGSSLFWQQSYAFWAGLTLGCVALVSLVIVVRNGKLGDYSFWLSLLCYALLMLVAITLGRSGVFGVWQALAPRYTTFSLLAVTSIYAVLVKTVFESKSRISTALLIVLAGAVLFSSALSYQKGLEAGRMTEAMRERAAAVLYNYESEPNQVLAMSLGTPSARVVKKYAPVLQELGYNVFSEPRARS